MFRSWKSAIGRAGELLNDESTYSTENPGQVASEEAARDASPLGRLLDDLKASEARRNGPRPNPEPETAPQIAPEAAPQMAPATVPQTAPATAPQTAKVETAMPDDVQLAPVASAPVRSDAALNGAQLDGVQRLI